MSVSVLHVWPKPIFLPVWPREATSLDTSSIDEMSTLPSKSLCVWIRPHGFSPTQGYRSQTPLYPLYQIIHIPTSPLATTSFICSPLQKTTLRQFSMLTDFNFFFPTCIGFSAPSMISSPVSCYLTQEQQVARLAISYTLKHFPHLIVRLFSHFSDQHWCAPVFGSWITPFPFRIHVLPSCLMTLNPEHSTTYLMLVFNWHLKVNMFKEEFWSSY